MWCLTEWCSPKLWSHSIIRPLPLLSICVYISLSFIRNISVAFNLVSSLIECTQQRSSVCAISSTSQLSQSDPERYRWSHSHCKLLTSSDYITASHSNLQTYKSLPWGYGARGSLPNTHPCTCTHRHTHTISFPHYHFMTQSKSTHTFSFARCEKSTWMQSLLQST